MSEMQLELVLPSESLRRAYEEFVAEFTAAGEGMPGIGARFGDDFAAFVRTLLDGTKGTGIPEGYVPSSTWWLMVGDRIVGTCSIRHRLTERLRQFGGHIGYSIRPSERRKGYGTRMLRLALEKARQLDIARVLVTCNKNNIASARVVQKCRGVLESEGVDPGDGELTQRYWIDTSTANQTEDGR